MRYAAIKGLVIALLGCAAYVCATHELGWLMAASVMSIIPSEGVAIVVLTNEAGDPLRLVMPIAQQLAAVVR